MKTLLLAWIGVPLVGGLLALNTVLPLPERETTDQNAIEVIAQAEVTPLQEKWLFQLSICESGANQNAVNKNDLDNTPSWGMYQFKHTVPSERVGKRPNTWQYYVQKYDLFGWQEWDDADWENALMSGWHQHQVLLHMISDPDVKWTQEFPSCVKLLGLPPNDSP